MRILVTGSTGYIGLNVVAELAQSEHEVRALVRKSSPTDRLPGDVETATGDLESIDEISADGIDAVIHLAAVTWGDADRMWSVNVDGTRKLIQYCETNGVDDFVFASTIQAHPLVRDNYETVYKETKLVAERDVDDSSLNSAIVRPTFVLGPRDYRLARYQFFHTVAANRALIPPLYLFHDYNIVHVDDVARTMISALEVGDFRTVTVAGRNVSSIGLHREISNLEPSPCTIVPVPRVVSRYLAQPSMDELYRLGVSPVPSDQFDWEKDVGAVPDHLEWSAPVEQQSLRKTLKSTRDWYSDRNLL